MPRGPTQWERMTTSSSTAAAAHTATSTLGEGGHDGGSACTALGGDAAPRGEQRDPKYVWGTSIPTGGRREAHGSDAAPPGEQRDPARAAGVPARKSRVERTGVTGGTQPVRRRQEDEIDARLGELGIGGTLSVEGPRGSGMRQGMRGASEGNELVARLAEGVRRRVMATWNIGRIRSALAWWADFLRDTRRTPFVPLAHAGDIQAAVHNNTTLDMFAEYMRERGARQATRLGQALTSDYVASTVATIRLLRNSEAHYDVAPTAANTARPTLLKRMRQQEGVKGARKESRGFRARDFKAIAKRVDRASKRGRMRWATALAAHSMLLRGGEIGRVAGKSFEPARGITINDATEGAPSAVSRGLPWMAIGVVAIKDVQARHKRVPMIMRQRSRNRSDPLCAYTAVRRMLADRKAEVPACKHACAWCEHTMDRPAPGGLPPRTCARSNAPLFTTDAGEAFDTNDVRRLGSEMARLAGLGSVTIGAKLWRIGGATDLRDVLGMAGKDAIKERGRWASDIAHIYARALAGQQMDAAARMAEAEDVELEALCTGWVQPASFR